MRIYILTDQEGVAGVVNADDYGGPGGRYYEVARELTTLEVNAAITGAMEAGAEEFFVVDGHGHGSIDIRLLHPSARLLTGRPISYPFGFDASFDAAFFIGHHAKANTDGGHLSHTFSFSQEDFLINGRSLGEIGYYFLMVGHLHVPAVLVSGDQAACDEARELVPEVEVAPVKEGWKSGSATGLSPEENRRLNGAAVHLPPEAARTLIQNRASRAVKRAAEISPFRLSPPYELVSILRRETPGGKRRVAINRSDDLLELGRMPLHHVLEEEAIGRSGV